MLIYSVSDVLKFIKKMFSYEQIFYNITIMGEVSNFKYHDSGNMFFTLNDEHSSIKCVVFKINADRFNCVPSNGTFINASGDITIYEKTGICQLYVSKIEICGVGVFKKTFETLSEKLLNEGLFNKANKLSLPKFPKTIGVITSKQGAALQDVINVLSRRLPILKVKVFSCLVQGSKAINSILKSIKLAELDDEVESLIICRGGGSKEDLDPFDDEQICRAVFKLKKPTISAIGHETDNCLLDLVADLRAPTPSAAAELVCVDSTILLMKLNKHKEFLFNCLNNKLSLINFKIENLIANLVSVSPKNLIECLWFKVNNLFSKLNYFFLKNVVKFEAKIDVLNNLINNLNPHKILNKGYCVVKMFENKNDEKIINSIKQIDVKKKFKLMFIDGECNIKILNYEKEVEIKK